MLKFFKRRNEQKDRARTLYALAVAQARLPAFYQAFSVPDSVDGRFEMIALHCYLLMHKLKAAEEKALSQALFDVFFVNMDLSLREMGVGDLSVSKHMRRMMKGFNGRALSYEEALESQEDKALEEILRRNVYGTETTPDSESVAFLADYARRAVQALEGIDLKEQNPVFPVVMIEREEKRHA